MASGVRRRARTSAAMVGLALSMGATSLLVPRQGDGATAAESKTPEAMPSPVSRVATLPPEPSLDLPALSSTAGERSGEANRHTVLDGQTLQQIANQYQVAIQALALENGLAPTATLRPGQVLKIPTGATVARTGVQSPQVLALADLNRLPASPATVAEQNLAQLRSERDQSLNHLRQERNKLRDRLAELGREESGRVGVQESGSATSDQPVVKSAVDLSQNPGLSQNQRLAGLPSPLAEDNALPSLSVLPSPSSVSIPSNQIVAATPSPDPDWMQGSSSLTIPSAPVAGATLPSQGVASPRLVAPPVSVANSVTLPNEVAVHPNTLEPRVSAPLTGSPLLDTPREISYQVGRGDTVARIARAHGISQAALIEANNLYDPDVIFVGQVLRLPEARKPQAQNDASQQSSLPSVVPATRAAEAPAGLPNGLPTVPTRVVAAQSLTAVVPTTILSSPAATPVQPGVEVQQSSPTAVGGRNPYVQNLLTEVRSMRERRHQQASAPQSASEQVAPAQVAPVPLAAASPLWREPSRTSTELRLLETPAVRTSESRTPEVRTPEVVQSAPRRSVRTTQSAPAVVAAAPLGSENYEPLLQPVTGRMVSPDLPSLPDADRFLPNGTLKGYIWPARGILSSGYGWRWGRMHQGIDIAADTGTPIYAAASGVIEYAGWNSGGYGNMIEVRHSDGSMTRYAHLNAVYVQVGQRVSQSEQIGEMGSTGYSTGPHLHFEVHLPDQGTVNPIAYLPAE